MKWTVISMVLFNLFTVGQCVAQQVKAIPPQGHYVIEHNHPAQVIWGLGFEIQSDSIGSNNLGLPDKVVAVPNNLIPQERKRLYQEMLTGFRYCRLALGLYFRGHDQEGKNLQERYPGQVADLLEMQKESGIEGFNCEYWSPLPYWKSNGKLDGPNGTLKSFDDQFLNDFGDALVKDIGFLNSQGLHVVHWSLQNEPEVAHGKYSTCFYTPEQYLRTFKIVAPKIKKAYPNLLIHADSWDGSTGKYGSLLAMDEEAVKSIDAWSYHRVGWNSDDQIDNVDKVYRKDTHDKPVYNVEFEYLDNKTSDDRFVNTAQSIMNWMTFENSPTWFWLHALKPTYNVEASGYSLGFWRPEDDNDFSHAPQIKKGHWDYNSQNFNSIAGFLKYMPWDSRRISVSEDQVRKNNRIMAWKTPGDKLVIAFTNRETYDFQFDIETGRKSQFAGHRYTPRDRDLILPEQSGETLHITIPSQSVEFWVQQ